MNPLKEAILEKLPWLISEMGFENVSSYQYSPKSFGNCLVTLDGPAFRLRFALDRGEVLADLAPLKYPYQQRSLVLLLDVIHNKMPPHAFDIETVGGWLRDNYPELVHALGPDWENTRAELERRGRTRLEAMRNPVRLLGTNSARARVRAKWLGLRYRWAHRHELG